MISLCMIVKNEIDVFERCINSVEKYMSELVSEIIVVDSGSADGTREKALELGCKVFDFKWCDDFAKARNYGIEKANNDWIFVLDADEYIDNIDIDVVQKFLIQQNENILAEVSIKNFGDEKGQSFGISEICRLFCKKNVRYTNPIHEIPVLTNGEDEKLVQLPIYINHTGYTKETINKKDKTNRNIALIKKTLDIEENNYFRMHLGKSYIELGEYENALIELKEVIEDEKSYKYTYFVESIKEYMRCCINSGKFEIGLVCEDFWDRCNYNDEYVYYLGHVYMKNGYFEKAMDCFINVINREKHTMNKKDSVYSLAQLFEILGFEEESLQYYKMCGEHFDALEKVKELSNNELI